MNRTIGGQNILFGMAAFFALILTFFRFKSAADSPDLTASYALGQAIGPVLLAVVARGIYVGVRWRWSPVPFLSGWLLVLVAAFAFLGNLSSLNSQAADNAAAKQDAASALSPERVVDSWISTGAVVVPQWCRDVAGHEDLAFRVFKDEYGTAKPGEPSAEALWNEMVSRCPGA